ISSAVDGAAGDDMIALTTKLHEGTGDGAHSRCGYTRGLGSFQLRERLVKVKVARRRVTRIEVASFGITFKGVEHGFGRQKGVCRGIGNGSVDASEFAKILQVLDSVSWIKAHDGRF